MEGLVFGKLTVIEFHSLNKRNEKLWLCKCECGLTKIVKSYNLKSGKTKSCGCIKTGPKPITPIGEKINRLIILDKVGISKCRNQLVECKCDCGTIFTTFLKNIKKGLTKSCGCLKIEVDNSRQGENNPNYDPSRSQEDREIGRDLEGYKDWRYAVKVRDNFTCRSCNLSKSGKLVSHHLDGYHWCPEKRCDIDNGVCLCVECHDNFHKIYGRKNNTKEQFKQYLKQNESIKHI